MLWPLEWPTRPSKEANLAILDQPSATVLPPLTTGAVILEARDFSISESSHDEPTLFRINDGKKVGTYLEHKFVKHLMRRYSFPRGNSASGIDLPSINVDIKVTNTRRPQSSCPFKSMGQKIFGLGYSLIIFNYKKSDDDAAKTSRLTIAKTVFVEKEFTGDHKTTRSLRAIMDRDGNKEDIIAFLQDKNPIIDEALANELASRVLANKPEQGYLGMTIAPQWRLRYAMVLRKAGLTTGIYDCLKPQEPSS
jgi:hypothetical protein